LIDGKNINKGSEFLKIMKELTLEQLERVEGGIKVTVRGR
jgi:hypothetical protein